MKRLWLANYQIILLSTVLLSIELLSCGAYGQQDYAIKDFPADLRPLLRSIVDKGYIESDSITKRFHTIATDEEIIKLAHSEHPLIRATAILEKLERDSLADNNFLIQHLDDTAVISKDVGEWGLQYTTVVDIMLDNAEWASDSVKMDMVREVILRHNNISAAFRIVNLIDPEPGLYSAIRDMATRERYFSERQKAMYALAAYQKKEDIALLQKVLRENNWRITETSFELMHGFPDTSYLSILENFFMHGFVRKVCRDANSFYAPVALNCLASYKEKRSAVILSKLWNMKTPNDCNHEWRQLKFYLLEAIWANKCESYNQLLKTTGSAKKARDKWANETEIIEMPALAEILEESTTSPRQKIRWLW